MKSSIALSLLVPAALALLAVPAFLEPAAPAIPGQAAAPEGSALDDSMQTLQAAIKGLDKALEKGDVEKSLGLVVDMEKAAHDAKLGTPEKAAAIGDPAEKAKFLAGYRLKLIELERGLLDVECALLEGKPADAKKALDTKVKPVKKAGHDAYKG